MPRLLVASGNPGKLAEIRALLAPLGIEALAQAELGIDGAPEPHASFVENALAKARHAARASGLPALADDSGLVVPSLGGAPGVRSAVYAGAAGGRAERDARNNEKLLAALAGGQPREACYFCVLVLVQAADDPAPAIAEGRWHGRIAVAPRGTGGFGYDPLFVPEGDDRTAAELDAAGKNRASHRARALARLAEAVRGR